MSQELLGPIKSTKREEEVIHDLLAGRNKRLEDIFPEDADPRDTLAQARAIASTIHKVETRFEQARGLLVPALGLLLFRSSQNPEILKLAGCDTISDFIAQEIEKHVSRSTAYAARTIWEKFGGAGMTPKSFSEVGISKLAIAAKECPKDASPAQRQRYFAMASESSSVMDLKREISNSGGRSVDAQTPTVFECHCSVEQLRDIQRLLKSETIAGAANTTDPADLLIAALVSFETECREAADNGSRKVSA